MTRLARIKKKSKLARWRRNKWDNLIEKCGYSCHWCGILTSRAIDYRKPSATTKEHLIPKSAGGTNALINLVVACRDCNNRRKSRTWIIKGPLV